MFNIKNTTVIVDPEYLLIPEFKTLWDQDKSKDKAKAYKELAYVYFMSDYKSPYNNYLEQERKDIVKKDFMNDEKYQETEQVKAAIAKYESLQETPSMRMLKASRKAQEKITKYFETGVCDIDVRELMMTLASIGKSIESVDKVEEKVKKEITNAEKIRGGGQIKQRER